MSPVISQALFAYFLAGGVDMKNLSDVVINFIIRMMIGVAIIFLANQYFAEKQMDVSVGMNPVTAVTSGALGVPGVCLLYGIVLYQGF